MNQNINYRRGLIKGVVALIGGVFFVQLTRLGLRAGPETEQNNQGFGRTSQPGMARHGFEGVSVAFKEVMLGSGKKLG